MADEKKATARAYRVLAVPPPEESSSASAPTRWTDCGTFSATSQDGALKAATGKRPELKKEGVVLVAIPPSSWDPVTREVEMVPRERFRAVGEQAKQAAAAEAAKTEPKDEERDA